MSGPRSGSTFPGMDTPLLRRPPPVAPAGPTLLDERGRPDFRDLYAREARRARALDAALTRIRLSALDLGAGELGRLEGIRVLLAEIDILTLTSEAEALAVRPRSRARLDLILELMESGTLEVRSAPLAGWAPDFSVFHYELAEPAVLIGPHWLQRPYPTGARLGCLHSGSAAARVGRRFSGLWEQAHDL
jgi:hypothetical protein